MSTQETTNASADPQAAYDLIVNRVHGDAYFGKLAEFGIKPTTQDEANALLRIGLKLASADVDTSAAVPNTFADIESRLDDVLVQSGHVSKEAAAQVREESFKAAALQLAADKEIYEAACTLTAQANA